MGRNDKIHRGWSLTFDSSSLFVLRSLALSLISRQGSLGGQTGPESKTPMANERMLVAKVWAFHDDFVRASCLLFPRGTSDFVNRTGRQTAAQQEPHSWNPTCFRRSETNKNTHRSRASPIKEINGIYLDDALTGIRRAVEGPVTGDSLLTLRKEGPQHHLHAVIVPQARFLVD